MQVTLEASFDKMAEMAALTHGVKVPENAEEYVSKIVYSRNHQSVAEFAVYCIKLAGISRHCADIIGARRLISIEEQSMRHVKSLLPQNASAETKQCFKWYTRLLDKGWKKEDARYVLNLLAPTNMGIVINRREMHILVERLRQNGKHDTLELADHLVKIMRKGGQMFVAHDNPKPVKEQPCMHCGISVLKDQDVKVSGPRAPEFEDCIITDKLSIVATSQLKRHRMGTLIRTTLKDEFHVPIEDPEFEAMLLEARTMEVPIFATKQRFTWKVNRRALANFLTLRMDKAAQKEIRDFAISINDALRS